MGNVKIVLLFALCSASINACAKSTVQSRGVEAGVTAIEAGRESGIVLYFHGRGGSSRGWERKIGKSAFYKYFQENGFLNLAPSSNSPGDWDTDFSLRNVDVARVDSLLDSLDSKMPIFVVGHSAGVGFLLRFVILSKHASRIKGVLAANAGGPLEVYTSKVYMLPTFFVYRECDQVTSSSKIKNAHKALSSNGVVSVLLEGASLASADEGCHAFVDSSALVHSFWKGLE